MPAGPVLLLSGPPGAGKSTVASLVAERFEKSACVETDWFWTTIVRGHIAPWLPEADGQNTAVINAFSAAVAALAEGGYAVVVDGIIGPWFLDRVVGPIRPTGAEVHYVVLRPGLDVVLQRATTRSPRTPTIAPLADEGPISALWQQFQDLGPHERHVIDSGALDPRETADLVWTRFGQGTDRL